jgi:hypothetical protein
MGLDFIQDGFIRAGVVRKALFLATGGLSGFVLKNDAKPTAAAKAPAKRARPAKPAKARRSKPQKATRAKPARAAQVRTRAGAKATRAKPRKQAPAKRAPAKRPAAKRGSAKPAPAKRPAARRAVRAPASVGAGAEAQRPAAAVADELERLAAPQLAGAPGAGQPARTQDRLTGSSEPLARPDPALPESSARPDPPTSERARFGAVEASAQAARRLSELTDEQEPSAAPSAINADSERSS